MHAQTITVNETGQADAFKFIFKKLLPLLLIFKFVNTILHDYLFIQQKKTVLSSIQNSLEMIVTLTKNVSGGGSIKVEDKGKSLAYVL